MTLSMSLQWKAPDSSALINGRMKDVSSKGFVLGADIVPVVGALEVDVTAFVAVTFDGAVARSDATERLTVSDGAINYVVLRARYVTLGSPILAVQVLDDVSYLADPELDWLHVVGVVDLSAGGFTSVSASEISYEERHEVDQQGRTSWRPSVATMGALPTVGNRDGDVRLARDTRSIYVWDATGSNWDLFDEVPLTNHRLLEHTPGIVAGANTSSLTPSTSGISDIVVAAVPGGSPSSGYIAGGAYVTAPAAPVTISALTFVNKGLLQVSANNIGSVTSAYRVQITSAITLTGVRIVDISDNHSVVAGLILTGSALGTVSWDNGPPVSATLGGKYRLYRPNGVEWVDVEIVGAIASASETYDVLASVKDDNNFLIAYYAWNGTNQLALGADRRTFGNVGNAELTSDFRNNELTGANRELRGTMVFSGGDVTNLAGLQVRVRGPLIAYINGTRYEVSITVGAERGWTGITLPNNTTSYLYVDGNGVFQVGASLPTTGLYATVAEVVTAGGAISTITDTRAPKIIIGTTADGAPRIFWNNNDYLEWNQAAGTLRVRRSGGLRAGTVVDVESVTSSTLFATVSVNAPLVNTAEVRTAPFPSDLLLMPQSYVKSVLGAGTILLLGAPTVGASLVTFGQGGTDHTLPANEIGYLGSDGGAIEASGTGTNFGIKAVNDLLLMSGGTLRVRLDSAGYINHGSSRFVVTPGASTRYDFRNTSATSGFDFYPSTSGKTVEILPTETAFATKVSANAGIGRTAAGTLVIGADTESTAITLGRVGTDASMFSSLMLESGVINRLTAGSLIIGSSSMVSSLSLGHVNASFTVTAASHSMTVPTSNGSTVNIAGANHSGVTKTINIGNSGQSTSTTNINLGTGSNGTVTINMGDSTTVPAFRVRDSADGSTVSMPSVYQRKSSTQTITTGSTSDIFTKNLPAGTYKLQAVLVYNQSAGGTFEVSVTASNGSGQITGGFENHTGGKNSVVAAYGPSGGSTPSITVTNSSGFNVVALIYLTITLSAAATVSLRGTANSQDTLVVEGSSFSVIGISV